MEIGNGTFLQGDCLELMAALPDGSVDMVLCDLPYGTTQNKWDSVIPFVELWEQYWRVCKPNAAVVLTAQCPFDKILGASQIRHLRYEWIWVKNRSTGFMNAKKAPLKNVENALVFYRNQPTYNPQMSEGKPYTSKRSGRVDTGDNYGKVGIKKRTDTVNTGERYPNSTLEIPVDTRAEFHPTQKPVALFEYLIRTYTNPGETVLDNTAGSGTTAIAAENAGRKWICMERDPDYYAAAVGRVYDHAA